MPPRYMALSPSGKKVHKIIHVPPTLPQTRVSLRTWHASCYIELALRSIEKGASVYKAAKEYRVPYSTLRRRTRGSYGVERYKSKAIIVG